MLHDTRRPLTERFWNRVQKSDSCWLWIGWKSRYGYGGGMNINGQRTAPHRVSWVLHNGEIPKGMFVLHKCDNRICVRPDHLFIGTQMDNMRDMDKKGRRKSTGRKGTLNVKAKLSEEDVKFIRKNYEPAHVGRETKWNQRAIAKHFNVHVTTISHIARGKTWRHI